MAEGYLDSVLTAWTLVIALDAEACSVSMKPLNTQIKLAHNLWGYVFEEFRWAIGINCIKISSEDIIFQI